MSARKKLRDGAKKPSPTKGGRNVEERLVTSGVVLETVGLAHVGNKDDISPELVNEVRCKAFCWEISYEGIDGAGGDSYNGQLGIIRGQRITPSPQQNDRIPKRQKTTSTEGDNTNDTTQAVLTPSSRFAVTPTTALHNVVDYPHKNEYFSNCKVFYSDPPGSFQNVVFPQFGQSITPNDAIELVPADTENDTDAFQWKSHDVASGNSITDAFKILTQKRLTFEKAPQELPIVAGMKIGLAVYRTFDIEAADTGSPMEPDELLRVYGPKNSVCVFTGEVTAVHQNRYNSFEHSINTFRGCSGAIIFLLDRNQPTTQIALHGGKAIGVHVGGKPAEFGDQPANIGFRL